MPNSVLDIVDTAIKIGLGALITSAGSYLLSKQTHDREAKKERINKEREILEKVAEEFETFSYAVFSYWALHSEWNNRKVAGKPLPEERQKLFDEARRDYFVKAQNLTNAEAKLLLLGQIEAQAKLREFADLLIEYRKHVFERLTHYEQDELKEWRRKILEARKNFFDSLSSAFTNL